VQQKHGLCGLQMIVEGYGRGEGGVKLMMYMTSRSGLTQEEGRREVQQRHGLCGRQGVVQGGVLGAPPPGQAAAELLQQLLHRFSSYPPQCILNESRVREWVKAHPRLCLRTETASRATFPYAS